MIVNGMSANKPKWCVCVRTYRCCQASSKIVFAFTLRINKSGLNCVCQESLTAQLSTREKEMEGWRKERDTLVSALEVQLKKLIMSNAEKDKQIQILQSTKAPEVSSVLVSGLLFGS